MKKIQFKSTIPLYVYMYHKLILEFIIWPEKYPEAHMRSLDLFEIIFAIQVTGCKT